MKCVSLDLDGTLLRSDGSISEENLQAVQACIKKGYHVVINTGRSYEEVLSLPELETLKIPFFLGNGSEIRDSNRNIIQKVSIEFNQAKKIIDHFTNLGRAIRVYTDTGRYESLLENILNKNSVIYKVIILGVDAKEVEEILNQVSSFGSICSIHFSKSKEIEFSSPNATKGKALLQYIEKQGVSVENTAAFGDEENDISQFAIAGHKVIMGNAKAYMKAYGNMVTKTNNEHGVAYALREILKWI